MGYHQNSWCCLRTATLILSGLGACANFYIAAKLVSIWFSYRWANWGADGESSEWEGYAWTTDAAKALGAVVCAYFFVSGVASFVGLVGVVQRRTSSLRLFRDYSIADLMFGSTFAVFFTFASTQRTLRTMLCEELSRQPDILRGISNSTGLNMENCESFIDKAVIGAVLAMFVGLFIRLQFTLTVLNYYTHLRRTEQHQYRHLHSSQRSSEHRRHRSSTSSQRIIVLSAPLPASSYAKSRTMRYGERDVLVYAPVSITLEEARQFDGREALLVTNDADLECGNSVVGSVQLPIIEGEAPWSRSRGHTEKV